MDAHPLPQAGGRGAAGLRQRRGVEKSHPRPPQRDRGGDENTARRLPLVRSLPRRGGASARPHDGLVGQTWTSLSHQRGHPTDQVQADQRHLPGRDAPPLRAEVGVPGRTGAAGAAGHAGAGAGDAGRPVRPPGGRAAHAGAGGAAGNGQRKENLRLPSQAAQGAGG